MSKNQQELHYPEPVREPALSRTLFIATTTIALYFTDTLLACLNIRVYAHLGVVHHSFGYTGETEPWL